MNLKISRESGSVVLIAVSWSAIMSFIMLQAIYQRAFLSFLDLAFLFAFSVFAGLILVDVGRVIWAYVGAFSVSVLIMFFCLTLPATLGKVRFAFLGSLVYQQALILIVSNIFLPTPVVVLCLLGGVLGGFLGEFLHLA